MNGLIRIFLPAAVSVVFVSACTWVKTTPEGEGVRVVSASAVGQCEKLGTVKVSLKHNIGRIERKPEKVATELQTLARNEGAAMGGDAVVAMNQPSEGRQEFGVYDCQPG